MSLIRFKEATTLNFLNASISALERVSFSVDEIAEFEVHIDDAHVGLCTLREPGGKFAPYVSAECFEVLPPEFRLFRFTQTVDLRFATRRYNSWDWEESKTYDEGSVYCFKKTCRGDSDSYYPDFETPEGRIMPGVPSSLIVPVQRCEGAKTVVTAPVARKLKQVVEAFPEPVPGVKGDFSWGCPYSFNDLKVVRDENVPASLSRCSKTPVAYLRLVEGDGRRYDKLYYRCSFFGVPKVVAKV